jgi:hypothetical protein
MPLILGVVARYLGNAKQLSKVLTRLDIGVMIGVKDLPSEEAKLFMELIGKCDVVTHKPIKFSPPPNLLPDVANRPAPWGCTASTACGDWHLRQQFNRSRQILDPAGNRRPDAGRRAEAARVNYPRCKNYTHTGGWPISHLRVAKKRPQRGE